MKNLKVKTIRFLIILTSITLLLSCATKKAILPTPLYQSDSFDATIIDNILILPTVDLRLNKEAKLKKLDKWVHSFAAMQLKRRKYKYTIIEDRSIVENITEEDLDDLNTEFLKNLYSSHNRWVLLMALHDVKHKLTFGSTGNAEISSFLIDMNSGIVLWRDKGIGEFGQGGLVGMSLAGASAGFAIKNAAHNSLVSLPYSW